MRKARIGACVLAVCVLGGCAGNAARQQHAGLLAREYEVVKAHAEAGITGNPAYSEAERAVHREHLAEFGRGLDYLAGL